MQREIQYKEHVLVVIGTFNPAIFQPWWFAANGIIGAGEAEAATAQIKVIHSTATQFSLGMLDIQVAPSRFVVTTSDESRWDFARDLVINCFKKSRHTPVSAVGINMSAHFRVKDEQEWHAIGHKLVPKEAVWSKIFKKPGMKSVTVTDPHPEGLAGSTNVKIEPSMLFKPGIYIDVNDHNDLKDKTTGKLLDGFAVAELLEKRWKESIANSNSKITTLMDIL